MPNPSEKAYLAGGCFWCLDAVYRRVKGVEAVVSGYAGGEKKNPNYEEVSAGDTGHAETVEVTYDPGAISFEDILSIFFYVHDPTSVNRQGNDAGPQYRSAIFAQGEDQLKRARFFADSLRADYSKPLVTEIRMLERFWPAEDYHQDYFAKNPDKAYCRAVIAPKVAKLREKYREFAS